MEECNKEHYLLQGSLDGVTWVTLETLPFSYVSYEVIEPYKYCRFFVIRSDITGEILTEIENKHE